MTSPTAFVIGAVVVAAACGGGTSDDTRDTVDTTPTTESPAETSVAPVAPTDPTAPQPTAPVPTDVSTSSTSPAATTVPGRPTAWLATVLADERGRHGWRVPPGTWTTSAFASPVTFTTTAELTLVGEYGDLVLFRDPASVDVPRFLYVARASFLKDQGASVPIPSTPAEVTALIESNPDVDLVDMGTTVGGQATWWDVTIPNFSNGAPYGCELGDACGPISFAASGGSIDTLEGETARIYRTEIDGRRIGAYVTGPTEGREPLLEIAGGIVTSFGSEQPSEPPPDTTFFGALGTSNRSIPVGTHVARFPEATLTFAIDDEIGGFSIDLSRVNTIWITTGDFGLGIVPADWLIDPSADQLEMRGTDEPVFTYVDPAIETVDEFLAWSTAMNGPATDVGTMSIGGADAVVVDDSNAGQRIGNTGPCDPPNTSTSCYTSFTTDGLRWFNDVDGDATGATAFIEAANVIVTIVAFESDQTIADATSAFAPVLDSLTITSVTD